MPNTSPSPSTNPNLKIAKAIREILADGEPHFEIEIFIALLDVVPPEIAIARYEGRAGHGSKLTIGERIKSGIRTIARSTLIHMREQGQIVDSQIDGKRAWTMIDEDRLQWEEALRKKGIDVTKLVDPMPGEIAP